MTFGTLLACFIGLCTQETLGSLADPLARCLEVELAASDPPLEGRGYCRRVEYASDFEGVLHVWAEAEALDAFLRAESAEGELLVEDDNAGGGTTPCLAVDVEPGTTIYLCLSARPGEIGAVRLHLIESPETETTRILAGKLGQALQAASESKDAGDLEQARGLLARAVEEMLAAPERHTSRELSRLAFELGRASFELSDPRTAQDAWNALLEFKLRCLPPDEFGLQWARLNSARAASEAGDLDAAHKLEEQALQSFSRILPPEHLDLQKARLNLAGTVKQLGNLALARNLEEQALGVLIRVLHPDNPDLYRAEANLAYTMHLQGDLTGARELEERVLEALMRTLPEDHPDLQLVWHNLAISTFQLGDLANARELQERVLEARSRTLPADHPDLQSARVNLANTLRCLGDLSGALELERLAVDLYAKVVPPDHPDLQWARGNLAVTLHALERHVEARELEEGILETRLRTLPPDHPELQRARFNLAATVHELGELELARELNEQVVEVLSRTRPEGHPDLQMARSNLVLNLVDCGEREQALSVGLELARSMRASIRDSLGQYSPRELEERVRLSRPTVDSVLGLALESGNSEAGALLQRESLALIETIRAVGLVGRMLESEMREDPALENLRALEREHSSRLAELGATGGSRDEISSARRALDLVRRQRVAHVTSRGGQAMLLEPTVDRLSQALGEDQAIVAYWRRNPKSQEEEVDTLLAAIVRPRRKTEECLTWIDLGPTPAIEQATLLWRDCLAGGDRADIARGQPASQGVPPSQSAAGEALRSLVFDPLLPAIGSSRTLILVLDDFLHAVPFDALPRGDRLLGNEFSFEVRLAIWELFLPDRPSGSAALLALGNVAYGNAAREESAHGEALGSASPPCGAASGIVRAMNGGEPLDPLPATAQEIHLLVDLYQQAFEGAAVFELQGERASREALIALVPKARFLHLATHGWFAPDSVASTADAGPLDARAGLGHSLSAQEQVLGSSPMLLCGLALAGANLSQDHLGRIRGLITAEEVASLDLRECELAVLSACDTNVGIRRAGQGVESLQKALHMAGARSAITSLWKVPDEATKELMVDFYRRVLIEKKPKAKALWEAKMKLYRAVDREGRPLYFTRDWAAWMLTGSPH